MGNLPKLLYLRWHMFYCTFLGRHCDDEWRQLHITRSRCVPSCCQKHDWAVESARWRSRRWHDLCYHSEYVLQLLLCLPSLDRFSPSHPPSTHHSLFLPFAIIIVPHHILLMMIGGEILGMAEPLLNRNFHPTVIVSGYCKALQKALEVCSQICRIIDVDNIKVCTASLNANAFYCMQTSVLRDDGFSDLITDMENLV